MARSERDKLIEKLKTVRNPGERDRIFHLLAGQEYQPPSASVQTRVQEGGRAEKPLPDQASPPAQSEPTPTQLKIGKLIGYAFPVFFLIAGAVLTIEMLAEVGNGKTFKQAFMENPTGIFFIFFGLLGLLKNKKSQKPSANI